MRLRFLEHREQKPLAEWSRDAGASCRGSTSAHTVFNTLWLWILEY